MIHLSLLGQSERVYPDKAFFPREFAERGYAALFAQWRTFDVLVREHAGIVLNTYATGSGKTKAALLYLHELRKRGVRGANCLFIAPTNELIEQHARDIREFCARNDLDYQVLPLTRRYMDDYAEAIAQSSPDITRRAAKMVEVLRDPRSLEDASGQAASPQRPYILVTNPDIFYYAVFNGYGRNEERGLMRAFLERFSYLVIDEFHYYNPKQLANFLFFLAVWRHYGFFKDGAKVCLLSATPGARVREYLRGLGIPLIEVSPDQEADDEDAPRVASLAPVEMDVLTPEEAGSGGLLDLVMQRRTKLAEWLDRGQQGAIISGALWRINVIHEALARMGIPPARFARLTGPERREARGHASQCDLILATPTVDLGYNFERANKPRQSIDFLFFDAMFADECVQRLGRAGRVLGKPETTFPSQVVAILPRDLVEVLRPLEGRAVSRAELRVVLGEAIDAGQLPERNAIFDYIASGAVEEAFLPIFRLRQMSGEPGLEDIKTLYEGVRTLFGAAGPRYHFECLVGVTRRYRDVQEIFRGAPTDPQQLISHLRGLSEEKGLRAWLRAMKQSNGQEGEPNEELLDRARKGLKQPGSGWHTEFIKWARTSQREYAVRAASFNFRESFEPPQAHLYDPRQLLSSNVVVDYDVFSVVRTCEVEVFDETQWSERAGTSVEVSPIRPTVLYGEVLNLRQPEKRLRLRFHLNTDEEHRIWESTNVCRMTAMLNVQVSAENGQLPSAVIDAIREQFIPAFLAPRDEHAGIKLMLVARQRGFHCHDLLVTCASGTPHEYYALFGTSALLAAAHLRRESAIFHKHQEQDFSDPIWC